ncbi:hypothetical protein C8Q72DRAFT_466984 [Fomitopsis betulina]|nr:hypothetical protein C8Q72DRAFT_466984 [Fomitopsis betulina]
MGVEDPSSHRASVLATRSHMRVPVAVLGTIIKLSLPPSPSNWSYRGSAYAQSLMTPETIDCWPRTRVMTLPSDLTRGRFRRGQWYVPQTPNPLPQRGLPGPTRIERLLSIVLTIAPRPCQEQSQGGHQDGLPHFLPWDDVLYTTNFANTKQILMQLRCTRTSKLCHTETCESLPPSNSPSSPGSSVINLKTPSPIPTHPTLPHIMLPRSPDGS